MSCSAKKPLGLDIKGLDQAIPLLKTLQPLASLRADVLPMTYKVLCDWASSLASAPTTLPLLVCTRAVCGVAENGEWEEEL